MTSSRGSSLTRPTRTTCCGHLRSILVRHVRHARFPRDLLATSSRGCHEDATRKTASVEFKLNRVVGVDVIEGYTVHCYSDVNKLHGHKLHGPCRTNITVHSSNRLHDVQIWRRILHAVKRQLKIARTRCLRHTYMFNMHELYDINLEPSRKNSHGDECDPLRGTTTSVNEVAVKCHHRRRSIASCPCPCLANLDRLSPRRLRYDTKCYPVTTKFQVYTKYSLFPTSNY